MTDRIPLVTVPRSEPVLHRIEPDHAATPAHCPPAAQALLDALRAWEPDARLHMARVGDMAERIGRFIGLDSERLATVSLAAHLHDIGKLRIPAKILTKPDRLTESEYELVKEHSAEGAKLLQSAGVSDEIVAIVHAHHEWWDGLGYPAGLCGEEIPLASRMIAVVDTWDAISARRTYHRRRTEFVALSEIRKGAGTQFDPDLAPAFIDFACQRLMASRRCA